MLSSLPIIAFMLLPYTICTLASPITTSDLATRAAATETTNAPGNQSPPDLSSTLDDLVIPQEERPENSTTAMSSSRRRRSQPDLASLLADIGDFRLPSNITAGHIAKVTKAIVPTLSDSDIVQIVQALRPVPSYRLLR